MSELVLWSAYQPWPIGTDDRQLAEYDLVEARGFIPTQLNFNTHAWTHAPGGNTDRAQPSFYDVTPGQYHRFVAWLGATFVEFYLNGVLVHRRNMTDDPFPVFGLPVSINMGCWFGTAGDGWAGEQGIDYPIDTQMEIDYVRYYARGHDQ